MEPTVERQMALLAARQEGHLTRAQLERIGLRRSTIIRRSDAGLLVPVGNRTFRLPSVPRSLRGDAVAATLDHGAVASHWTAAWLHGFAPHRPTLDITVVRSGPRSGLIRRGGESPDVRVHSTTSLPRGDVHRIGAIRLTSVARTTLGLAALVPTALEVGGLRRLVDATVDEGLATDPWLWWLLSERRCRGRNGVSAFESVLADRARLGPTESWLEREVLRILETAGLPLPTTQQVIRRRGRFAARVDFLYEPERVVVEAMGYTHHRTEEQVASDLARANELQVLGFDVYQFVTRQVVCDPASVVGTVRAALRRSSSTGPTGSAAC